MHDRRAACGERLRLGGTGGLPPWRCGGRGPDVGAEAVLGAAAGSRLARDGVVCKPRAPAWMKPSAATQMRQVAAGAGDVAGCRYLCWSDLRSSGRLQLTGTPYRHGARGDSSQEHAQQASRTSKNYANVDNSVQVAQLCMDGNPYPALQEARSSVSTTTRARCCTATSGTWT